MAESRRVFDRVTSFLDKELLKDTFKVLLVGKTGSGKSHLVNALIGVRVAKEGEELDPCTDTVEAYSAEINGSKVMIWDSPGLQDGLHKDKHYLKAIKPVVKDVDLLVYCIRMDQTRFVDDERNAITAIANMVRSGPVIWNKTIFVLTFANRVRNEDDEVDLGFFQRKFRNWQEKIQDFIADTDRQSYIEYITCGPRTITLVPAGNMKKRRLTTTDDWISDYWLEAYKATSPKARLNLLSMNRDRLQFTGESSNGHQREHKSFIGGAKQSKTESRGSSYSYVPNVSCRQSEGRGSYADKERKDAQSGSRTSRNRLQFTRESSSGYQSARKSMRDTKQSETELLSSSEVSSSRRLLHRHRLPLRCLGESSGDSSESPYANMKRRDGQWQGGSKTSFPVDNGGLYRKPQLFCQMHKFIPPEYDCRWCNIVFDKFCSNWDAGYYEPPDWDKLGRTAVGNDYCYTRMVVDRPKQKYKPADYVRPTMVRKGANNGNYDNEYSVPIVIGCPKQKSFWKSTVDAVKSFGCKVWDVFTAYVAPIVSTCAAIGSIIALFV